MHGEAISFNESIPEIKQTNESECLAGWYHLAMICKNAQIFWQIVKINPEKIIALYKEDMEAHDFIRQQTMQCMAEFNNKCPDESLKSRFSQGDAKQFDEQKSIAQVSVM